MRSGPAQKLQQKPAYTSYLSGLNPFPDAGKPVRGFAPRFAAALLQK